MTEPDFFQLNSKARYDKKADDAFKEDSNQQIVTDSSNKPQASMQPPNISSESAEKPKNSDFGSNFGQSLLRSKIKEFSKFAI